MVSPFFVLTQLTVPSPFISHTSLKLFSQVDLRKRDTTLSMVPRRFWLHVNVSFIHSPSGLPMSGEKKHRTLKEGFFLFVLQKSCLHPFNSKGKLFSFEHDKHKF